MKYFLSLMIFALALEAQGSLCQADFRVAYFRPDSAKVRDIYGCGWPEYQFELSRRIYNRVSLWASVSGFCRDGYSIGEGDPTRLQFIPVGLGLKYQIPFSCNLALNLGAGATYSFLKIHDQSPFVEEYTRKQSFGAVLKSDLSYTICNRFVVSVFADYQIQKFRFSDSDEPCINGCVERHDLNMNGLKAGLGLGIQF